MAIHAQLGDLFDLHRYYRREPGYVFLAEPPHATSERTIDLATVSFNNPVVVRYQAKLLGKHLQDDYAYTVFDNSPPGPQRRAIRDVCGGEGASYVELPATPFAGVPSRHHGAALNWICRRHFARRRLPYVGLLDHDIFPWRPTSVVRALSRTGVFGRVEERGERWYLWPGFCFFSRERVRVDRLDFLPAPGLDTGGGNWRRVFRHLDKASLPPVENTLEDLRDGGDKQADMVERLGDWLHTINASEWRASHGKMALVERLLAGL